MLARIEHDLGEVSSNSSTPAEEMHDADNGKVNASDEEDISEPEQI